MKVARQPARTVCRTLLVVVLAVGTLFLAGSPPAAASPAGPAGGGGVGVRLLDAPSDSTDPRAKVYIVDHVAPGTFIQRRVEVANDSDQPADMSLYAGAADVSSGSFAFGDGAAANELTSWTTVTPADLELQPGARGIATVTVAVPADAAPGERYAVAWAQRAPTGPAGGIAQIARAGIRLYLSVGPGNPPASDFTIDSFQASRRDDGTPVVQATVHNTGGRALDLAGELTLSDGPGGTAAGPFPAALGTTIGPALAAPVQVELNPQTPPGSWQVRITLRTGPLERSAIGTLVIPADNGVVGAATAAEPSPRGGWSWRRVLLIVALLVTFVAAGVVVTRRRRARD